MADMIRRLAELATGQHGAVTRAQLRAAGLTEGQLRSRVQSGILEPVGARTFRSPFAGTSPLADLAALVLDCGESAVVSGPTAAALYGFDGFRLRAPFHVTVARGRNIQRVGHHLHTTSELPLIDQQTVEGLRTMSATRTVIDLARFVDAAALTRALDSALRDGRTSEDFLHRRIVELRSSGRYGIPRLLEVLEGREVTRGGHSWLERRFLQLCALAGLPRPKTQVVLSKAQDRVVRVDATFPGTRLVVELLGYRWHRSRAQLDRDAARLNALIMDGFQPLQFTYQHVTVEGDWVIEQLRRALQLAA